MESKMQDRLEGDMSEYARMREEIEQWKSAAAAAKSQRDVIIDESVEKTGRILMLEEILANLCEIKRRAETSDPDLQPHEAFEGECWQKALALNLVPEDQKPEIIPSPADKCPKCHGSGDMATVAKYGGTWVTCDQCGGTGKQP